MGREGEVGGGREGCFGLAYVEVDLTVGPVVAGAVGDVGFACESGAIGLRGDKGEMDHGEEELKRPEEGTHFGILRL